MSFSLTTGKEGRKIFYVKGGRDDKKVFKLTEVAPNVQPIRQYETFGDIHIIPDDPTGRFTCFISGPAGAGKSYICAQIASDYKKMYPQNTLFLVSPKRDDKIMKLNPKILAINEENFINDPITLEELAEENDKHEPKGCLLICDDFEGIESQFLKGVRELIGRVLMVGRSYKISIIIISHIFNDYRNTTVIHNECNCIIFFPKAGSDHPIKAFLEKHVSMGKNEIKDILSVPSRYVCLFKSYPMFYTTQHSFKFL